MPHLPRLTPLALSLALLLGSGPLLAAEQPAPAIEDTETGKAPLPPQQRCAPL